MTYTTLKTDCKLFGGAFETAIKTALHRKNANKISPCGSADFRYNGKNYDTKQNGSPIKYGNSKTYVKGSNRIIYATHIAYNSIVDNGDGTQTIDIDLANTDMFVVDKKAFVAFLLENGLAKVNDSRNQINIQTVYNYKKDDYHGKKGKLIEQWCYDNEIDDDIIGDILAGLE